MQWSTAYMIGNKEVCLNSFLCVLNFPKSTFYQIRKRFIEGKSSYLRPGRISGFMGPSANYFVMWINNFASKYADKLPDSFKFHLPCCLTKSSIHQMMCQEALFVKVPPISYSHMMTIWRKQLAHIKIPKKTRFSQCDTCLKLKDRLATCQDKVLREELIKKRKKHLDQQNSERQKYYKHASKAKSSPSSYLSIILDAMDQEKTSIPRFCTTPKSLGNVWKLKVNLMGALIHGVGVYGFFDTFQWQHGACYTISVLVQVLLLMDNIPDTLYLQLDNCPGQNKNRYVLGFLAKLVEEKIFKKVKLSFLMVGHTHEDIDQLFSRFSVWCSKENIFTLDDLVIGFEKCCKHMSITGIKTSEVYDFQEWLNLNNIRNHSYPHVFKITLAENGKAVISYKKWTTDKKWLSCSGSEDYLIQDMTTNKVNQIPSTTEKMDIDRIKHDILQVARFYEKEAVSSWWMSFFNELEEDEDKELEPVDVVSRLRAMKIDEPSRETPVAGTLNMPEVDDPIPEVIIGKKNKHIQKADLKEGDLVLTDTPLSPEDWPQVAKVLEILANDRVVLQPFWGKKTTTWTPACKRPRGEIVKITVSRNVIWYHGFLLTPSGYLPKHVKDMVEAYEDENL